MWKCFLCNLDYREWHYSMKKQNCIFFTFLLNTIHSHFRGQKNKLGWKLNVNWYLFDISETSLYPGFFASFSFYERVDQKKTEYFENEARIFAKIRLPHMIGKIVISCLFAKISYSYKKPKIKVSQILFWNVVQQCLHTKF